MAIPHELAEQQRAKARAALPLIVGAGVEAGLWSVVTVDTDTSNATAVVLSAYGQPFHLTAGTYTLAGRVEISILRIEREGMRVCASDVRNGRDAPTAAADASRDPLAVARDLHRRCIDAPDTRKLAARMAETLQQRIDQRMALLDVARRLAALGFHTDPASTEYYAGRAFAGGLAVRYLHNGAVTIDSVTLGIDDVPALMTLLGKGT